MAALDEKANEWISRHRMLPRGAAVIAALSGGADSMALLFFLKNCASVYGISLSAAHLNHGLRGEEADRDEAFVRTICGDWNIPLTVGRKKVREEAQRTGENEEECGRRVRYDFLESLAAQSLIATAHTLSDQAETLLLHLTRGTGLRGLCGIPPVRGRIIRPFLTVTRQEIEQYCREHQIPYVTDTTNLNRTYSRNRIRLDAIPALRAINPAFEQGVARCAESLRMDEMFLEELAHTLLKKTKCASGYDAKGLHAAPLPVRRRALRILLEQYAGRMPEAKHLEALEALLIPGGKMQLAAGCIVRVRRGLLEFPPLEVKTAFWCVRANAFGADYPFGRVDFSLLKAEEAEMPQKIHKDQLDNFLDCDRIKGALQIRSRQQGDQFEPVGRHCTKSLKKLFNEAGVPPERRGQIAMLSDDDGILFVEGFGPDARAAVTFETKRILQISFHHIGEPFYDR